MKTLADKHRRFANEYFKTGKAGPSYQKYYTCTPAAACTAGWRLLKREDVQAHLAKLEAHEVEVIAEEKVYSEREALEAETRIADVDFIEMYDENGLILDPKDWPKHLRKAVKTIDYEDAIITDKNGETQTMRVIKRITFNARGGALNRIERCYGMHTEKVEHSGQVDIRAILARIDGLNRGKLPQDCD